MLVVGADPFQGPIAALPVPYRTTEKEKTFYALTDPKTGES